VDEHGAPAVSLAHRHDDPTRLGLDQREPTPTVEIHPNDACELGLEDGDLVRLTSAPQHDGELVSHFRARSAGPGVRAVPFPARPRQPAHHPVLDSVRENGGAQVLRGPPRGGARGGRRLGPSPPPWTWVSRPGGPRMRMQSTQGLGRAVAKALAQEGARVAINGRHEDSVEHVARQLSSETGQAVLPFPRPDVGAPRADRRPGGAGPPRDGSSRRTGSATRAVRRRRPSPCSQPKPSSAPGAEPPVHDQSRARRRAIMRKVPVGPTSCLASVAAKATPARAHPVDHRARRCPGVREGTGRRGRAPRASRERRVSGLHRDGAGSRSSPRPAPSASSVRPRTSCARCWPTSPLGRMGHPTSLAAAVAFLASDRASYITGRRAAGRRRLHPASIFLTLPVSALAASRAFMQCVSRTAMPPAARATVRQPSRWTGSTASPFTTRLSH